MRDKIKVLLLAVNPVDTPPLHLSVEARRIFEAIESGPGGEAFEIIHHLGLRVTDLQRLLIKHEPNIVHFTGHGSEEGELLFEDDSGKRKPIERKALASIFELHKNHIRLVFLNACFSEPQAEAISSIIDYTLGINSVYSDKAAIGFAAAFYLALAFERSVSVAFKIAKAELDLQAISGSDAPKLFIREGVDQEEPFLSLTAGTKHSEVPSQRVSWLHLSDFHFGGSDSKRYDADIVIESLLVDISERIEKDGLEPDFIAVTGDLALRGKSLEYKLVRAFFEKLLEITGLPRQRLFIVPGNHDVDRTLIEDSTLLVGKGLTDRQITNKILANRGDRRRFFARFKGYSKFFNEYFKGHLVFDDERFFYVHQFDTGNRRLAILGLNSSWLAASDEDEVLKLVIGERQTRAALKAAEDASAIIKIALLHHPNDWIRGFDQRDSMTMLQTNCDFVLHGHLHKAAATHLSTPDGSAMVIAGGACYDTREHPNSYNFVKLNLESNTGTIHFREYVDQGGGFWAKGVRLYRNAPDGVYEFSLPRK
jgi:predicted phosphodiesterase